MVDGGTASGALPGWHAQQWRVFGTGGRLVVPAGDDAAGARAAVDQELAAIDLAASRFREDSEIHRLNAALGRPVRTSELFAELIGIALDAARFTGGAVDPTLGAVLSRLGYDRTFRELPAQGPPLGVTIRRQADWRAVEFDPTTRTVRLPAGIGLDLGATAKAHASDRAARAATAATGGPVLVSLGGDIAVAGPTPDGGWPVAVADDSDAPLDADNPVVILRTGGLATSSTTVRQWSRGDQTVHHLLDPASGLPASGPWRTVSVAAASCLDANVAATAAVVLGAAAPDWLTDHALPARLVSHSGTVRTVSGWPEEE